MMTSMLCSPHRLRMQLSLRMLLMLCMGLGMGMALAGCAGRVPDAFDLAAVEGLSLPAHTKPHAQLIVDEPTALPPSDGDRILVRQAEQISIVADAQWRERLPRLLQTRLVQSLENAHFLSAVGRPESKMAAHYLLVTDIRRFDIDALAHEAVVDVSAKLIERSTGRIIAASLFHAQGPTSARDGAEASRGLGQALQSVLRDLVLWCAQYL
jgi:cholesterol transport system auxiliary component